MSLLFQSVFLLQLFLALVHHLVLKGHDGLRFSMQHQPRHYTVIFLPLAAIWGLFCLGGFFPSVLYILTF